MDLEPGVSKAGRSGAAAAVKSPLGGIHVLVVEDSPAKQQALSSMLRRRGAEILIAANGRLGVEALTEDRTIVGRLQEPPPVDFILMDMQMPEMDGYTATSLLREKGCQLPILAVTAHAMTGDRELCLRAGCDEYLAKPVVAADLERMILQLMERSATEAT
ncbi:response regulator [Planctellipticum variicoloris]|uniref:response regulator n=1 Tax=Planctellipticum variicoloris TaxID=3064265 RepID=UPI00301363F2|nr:response regulator [Planctomycetaceae bacterium SH412]